MVAASQRGLEAVPQFEADGIQTHGLNNGGQRKDKITTSGQASPGPRSGRGPVDSWAVRLARMIYACNVRRGLGFDCSVSPSARATRRLLSFSARAARRCTIHDTPPITTPNVRSTT